MTEEKYRKLKLGLLAAFVIGSLIIGGKISQSLQLMAENGHYSQYDRRKDSITLQNSSQSYPYQIIDTRTGAIQQNTNAVP
jgi:hypothetical protein